MSQYARSYAKGLGLVLVASLALHHLVNVHVYTRKVLPSTKFTIFIHLSPLMMTSTVLNLAVSRTPVTYELS